MTQRPNYRDDPNATRALVEQLIPDAGTRTELLNRFLASIEAAHAVNPASWEVTLRVRPSRPSLRLNVGPVLAFDLTKEAINIVVTDGKLSAPGSLGLESSGAKSGRYDSIPGAGWLCVPLATLRTTWPGLEADHFEAVRRAAQASTRTSYFRFHSPGAMAYIESELGRQAPRPDYGEISQSTPADELVRLVRKRYPDWDNFAHPAFVKDEIDYKRKAAARARELLGEKELRDLLTKNRADEIFQRLMKVAEATNLLYRSVPRTGDLSVLNQPDRDPQPIAQAVIELLHGDGDTPDRIDRFATWARDANLPCKWPFVTYFLFLLDPAREIFVKPERTRRFLGLIGSPLELSAEVSGQIYMQIRELVSQLLAEYETLGAQDMIDVQSAIFVASEMGRPTRQWKIAPGDGAWQWPECASKGFIAIGWEELGDVGAMTRAQYEARRGELARSHAGERSWSARAMDQVWRFSRIEEGDKVVANNGTTEVLGIGTVQGSYYFVPGVRHGHRLPVSWDDTTPRAVQFPSWLTTLSELKPDDFAAITSAPPVPPD